MNNTFKDNHPELSQWYYQEPVEECNKCQYRSYCKLQCEKEI
jgi:radical SAM protein with 4Fe4S-binding SPASM domain